LRVEDEPLAVEQLPQQLPRRAHVSSKQAAPVV
jgi:hypothetical protein